MIIAETQSDIFVGRADILKRLTDEWHAFADGSHTSHGFFLYAFNGMGKTWILRRFFHKIASDLHQQAIWMRILNRAEERPPLPQPAEYPERQFQKYTLPMRDGLTYVGEQLGTDYLWDGMAEQLDAFDLEIEFPDAFDLSMPVLICFDGVDLLERFTPTDKHPRLEPGALSLWQNLQHHWLRHILELDRTSNMSVSQPPETEAVKSIARSKCFVIFTGQGYPIFLNWEIDRRFKALSVERLSDDEMKMLLVDNQLRIRNFDFDMLPPGYPAAGRFLVTRRDVFTENLIRSASALEKNLNLTEAQKLKDTIPARNLTANSISIIYKEDKHQAINRLRYFRKNQYVYTDRKFFVDPQARKYLIEQFRNIGESNVVQRTKNFFMLTDHALFHGEQKITDFELFSDWLYYSLLLQSFDNSPISDNIWTNKFDYQMKIINDNLFLPLPPPDVDVIDAFISVNREKEARQYSKIIQISSDIVSKLEEVVKSIVSIPLDNNEWEIVKRLSNQNHVSVQEIINISVDTELYTYSNATSARKLLRKLRESHVVITQRDKNIVDPWLSNYLSRITASSDLYQTSMAISRYSSRTSPGENL